MFFLLLLKDLPFYNLQKSTHFNAVLNNPIIYFNMAKTKQIKIEVTLPNHPTYYSEYYSRLIWYFHKPGS